MKRFISVFFCLLLCISVAAQEKKEDVKSEALAAISLSNDYLTLSMNERGGSENWVFLYDTQAGSTSDSCYSQRFGVWSPELGTSALSSSSSSNFSVTQDYVLSNNDQVATAMLESSGGQIQVTKEVTLLTGSYKYFDIKYTLKNLHSGNLTDVRFFQVADLDIGGSGGDYGWYYGPTDYVYQNDDNYFKNGITGSIPSSQHGMDGYSSNNSDFLDGELNGLDKYPATDGSTADVGVSIGWNLGTLTPNQEWTVTVHFAFGGAAGIEANAGPEQNVKIGQTVNLDGSASQSIGTITSYTWDLDNDGEYDDASGLNPSTTFDAEGDYRIWLKVVDDGAREDVDDTVIHVIADNDLILENVAYTPASGFIDGQDLVITGTARNLGTEAITRSSYVTLNIGGSSKKTAYIPALAAGASANFELAYQIASGTTEYTVMADGSNNIREINEENNTFVFSIADVPQANLLITDASYDTGMAIYDGSDVIFDLTVKNSGAETLRSFYVSIWNGTTFEDSVLYTDGIGANEEIVLPVSWRAEPGSPNLIAKVDVNNYNSNLVDESDETDNEYTLPALSEISKSDLSVTAMTYQPSTDLEEGSIVTFTADLTNLGSPLERTFSVTLSIDDVAVNSRSVNGLTSTGTVDLTWEAVVGVHQAKVEIDSGNQVDESDETNNIWTDPASLPEVQSSNIYLSDLTYSPTTLTGGVITTIGAKVGNNGAGKTTKTIDVQFKIDDVIVDSTQILNGLETSEIRNVSFNWSAQPGTHTIKIEADPSNTIIESNETDNELSEALPEIQSVDLAVNDLTYSGTLKLGYQINMDALLVNNATADYAGSFAVKFYAGTQVVSTMNINGISDSQQIPVHASFTVNSSFSELKVVVDPDNDIAETNEDNNEAVQSGLSFSLPDFAVSNLTYMPASGISAGDPVQFTFDVSNIGTAEYLKNFSVQVLLDGDLIGSLSIKGGLLAGTSVNTSIPWTALPGNYSSLEAIVDPGGSIPEPDTANNTQTVSISLSIDQPDFTVTNLSYSPTTDLKAGDQVTLTATIQNNGADFSGTVDTEFLINDEYLGNISTLEALPQGGSATVSLPWTLPYITNPTLTVTADYTDEISETNEDNNSSTLGMSISVPQPDLEIVQVAYDPSAEVEDKDTVTISVTVKNNSSESIPYRSNLHMDIDDYYQRDYSMNSFAPMEERVYNYSWIATPGSNHQLSVIADSDEVIPEINEDNNTYAETIPFPVAPKESFTIGMDPTFMTGAAGGSVTFEIQVTNNGSTSTDYQVSGSNILPEITIDPFENGFNLLPQETKNVPVIFQLPFSLTDQDMTFQVIVTSVQTSTQKSIDATLEIQQLPVVYELTPDDGMNLGNPTVTFSYKTLVEAHGKILIKRVGEDGFEEYDQEGTAIDHRITVPGLMKGSSYIFSAQTSTDAGTYTSEERTININPEGGVIFDKPDYNFEVVRDYNQEFSVLIRNTHDQPHGVQVELENVPDDLIINFMGQGSSDTPVYLNPGQSYQLKLVAHLQDAQLEQYNLIANLTTLEDGDPITDSCVIQLDMLESPLNLELELLSENEYNLQKEYRLTNNGPAITDLSLDFSEDVKNTLYTNPDISHMRLGEGQSVEFIVIPILSSDAFGARFDTARKLRKAGKNRKTLTKGELAGLGLDGDMNFNAQGEVFTQQVNISVPVNKDLYRIVKEKVVYVKKIETWFCTNRPNVYLEYTISDEIKKEKVLEDPVIINFEPHSNAQPFDLYILMNGYEIGHLQSELPYGTFEFDLSPEYVNFPAAGVSKNQILIHSVHANPAHYVVGADLSVHMNLDSYDVYLAAESQSQAESIVDANLPDTIKLTPDEITAPEITIQPRTSRKGDFIESDIVQVGQQVLIKVSSSPGMQAYVEFSNGDGRVTLYEHSAGQYQGYWFPYNPGDASGNCTLTVTVKGTERYGQAQTTVQVQAAGELHVEFDTPYDGFAYGMQEMVPVEVKVTDENGNHIPPAQVSVTGTVEIVSEEGQKTVQNISFSPIIGNLFQANFLPQQPGAAVIRVIANDTTGANLEPGTAEIHGEIFKYLYTLFASKEGFEDSEPIQVASDDDNETFEGTVFDEKSNEIVPGARVTIQETGTSVITDQNGRYQFFLGTGDDDNMPVIADLFLKEKVFMAIEVEPQDVIADGENTALVTVTLTNGMGDYIDGAVVNIQLQRSLGRFDTDALTTDGSGQVIFTYTTPQEEELGGEEKIRVPFKATYGEDTIEYSYINLFKTLVYILKVDKPGFKNLDAFDVEVEFVNGEIRGRVITDQQEHAVRNARIRNLSDSEFEPIFTDDQGEFTIQVGEGGDEFVDIGDKVLPMQMGPVTKKLSTIRKLQKVAPPAYYDEFESIQYLTDYVNDIIINAPYDEAEKYYDACRRLGLLEIMVKNYDGYFEDASGYFITGAKNLINFAIGKLSLLKRIVKYKNNYGDNDVVVKRASEMIMKNADSLRDSFSKMRLSQYIEFGGFHAESLADWILGAVEKFVTDGAQGNLNVQYYQHQMFSFDNYLIKSVANVFYRSEAQNIINAAVPRSRNADIVGKYDTVSLYARRQAAQVSADYISHVNAQGIMDMLRVFPDAVNQVVKITKWFNVEPTTRAAMEAIDKISEALTVGFDVGIIGNAVWEMSALTSARDQIDDIVYNAEPKIYRSGNLKTFEKVYPQLMYKLPAKRQSNMRQDLASSFTGYNGVLNDMKTELSSQSIAGVQAQMENLYAKEDLLYADIMQSNSIILGASTDLAEKVTDFDEVFQEYNHLLTQDTEYRTNLMLYLALFVNADSDLVDLSNKTSAHIDTLLELNADLENSFSNMMTLITYNAAAIVTIPKVTGFTIPDYLNIGDPFTISYSIYNPSTETLDFDLELEHAENLTVTNAEQTLSIPGSSAVEASFSCTYTQGGDSEYSSVQLIISQSELFLTRFSGFVQGADITPPLITPIVPMEDQTLHYYTIYITAKIQDGNSAVNKDSVILKIDDTTLISPEKNNIDSYFNTVYPDTVVYRYKNPDLSTGAHTITVTAADSSGNSITEIFDFEYQPTMTPTSKNGISDAIANLQAIGQIITPNGDDRIDDTTISFSTSVLATLNAEIQQNGAPVKSFIADTRHGVKYFEFEWDGTDDSENPVDHGEYEMVVTAVADSGTFEKSIPIYVGSEHLYVSNVAINQDEFVRDSDTLFLNFFSSQDGYSNVKVYKGTVASEEYEVYRLNDYVTGEGSNSITYPLVDADNANLEPGIYMITLQVNGSFERTSELTPIPFTVLSAGQLTAISPQYIHKGTTASVTMTLSDFALVDGGTTLFTNYPGVSFSNISIVNESTISADIAVHSETMDGNVSFAISTYNDILYSNHLFVYHNNAAIVSENTPDSLIQSQVYNVQVKIENTGTKTWTSAEPYKWTALNETDTFTPEGSFPLTAGMTVPVGSTITIPYTMTAPAASGTYSIDWKIQEGSLFRFGQGIQKQVRVYATQELEDYNAAVQAETFPDNALAGTPLSVTLTMKNTGIQTWTAADSIRLGASENTDPLFPEWRVYFTEDVPHGASVAFEMEAVSPEVGSYLTDWQMLKEGAFWFGEEFETTIHVSDSTSVEHPDWAIYK